RRRTQAIPRRPAASCPRGSGMIDDLFFVYGSLKSEEWNNYILEDSVLIGPVVTKKQYFLTDCGFPYLIPANSPESLVEARTAPVYGELWYVPSKEVQASLDALEGVDAGHYERREIT